MANKPSKGVIIATLDDMAKGGTFAQFCLVIGAVAMVFEIALDSSAIRLAAWGAIWTGWNVLWGIVTLCSRRADYVVRREISSE